MVKLDIDFEAILKLQRKIGEYGSKRVYNVLPLKLFDDFEPECAILYEEILRRRVAEEEPIRVVVTLKDEREKRYVEDGYLVDYIQHNKIFIVQGRKSEGELLREPKNYMMHRLCFQLKDLEDKEAIE